LWGTGIFNQKHCHFVDIRHAAKRAEWSNTRSPMDLTRLVRPVWRPDDVLSGLLSVLFGHYPDNTIEGEIPNYLRGIRASMHMPDLDIGLDSPIPTVLSSAVTPIRLTAFGMSYRSTQSIWLEPAIFLGDGTDFLDLLSFWNLQAAGVQITFFDRTKENRFRDFVSGFIAAQRSSTSGARSRINIWGKGIEPPWQLASLNFDLTNLLPTVCGSGGAHLWNGLNIRPVKPTFSARHRDIVANYLDDSGRAAASFALSETPFDNEDYDASEQRYVVSVRARQYGPTSENLTFSTPFVPALNEFYGRNFTVDFDKARSESGLIGRGTIGVITEIYEQRIEVAAFQVQGWLGAFFDLVGIQIKRSEPGLRTSRLIEQLGGLRGTSVLKVRGARELIRKYGPDQSFTRSQAEKCIGEFDELTGKMRFSEFKKLSIQPRRSGELTPGEVLQFMTSRGIFRVGLEFRCPKCELASWHHLDDVRTISKCNYCGESFGVTPQLRDRDWRYRRSGLFGRDDHQLGGIPVALTLQQLQASLKEHLAMYSTAVEFSPASNNVERCEADFVAVVDGYAGRNEAPVQILVGEAKTHTAFNAEDVHKLGKLINAIPRGLAEGYVMFAKTDTFTPEEVALARTLNDQHSYRVILWSRDELEPYHVYERSEQKLGQLARAFSLSDMALATHQLWFK
jgi:hypothetical protein